ncbi:Cytochrome P450 [Niveomyces insectorum RCEF 264]|uniref:Cytochrome P450 n=1 Tax=Niveomyces insectorum RCEF 264 TaxID=1081102 RepID=A0A167SM18_9HYPO|nr:Cytochrome P450 [Niveomyces insectorum RCEF 264]
MIVHLFPFAVSLLVLAPIIYPLFLYLWDPKGLRKFPSPSCAAFTPLWRLWHNLQFRHYAAVDAAHKRLGTHVRIAPNHVSILDPRAPNEIYGHGANMLKEEWYDAGAGAHRNLADTRDKAEHQAKRKMLAHAFAAKTVTGLEPVLLRTIGALMKRLDAHAGAHDQVNMRLLLNYFTIDLFGNLLFSAHMGCLERGDDLLDAETREGAMYKVPFIGSLLDATVANTALAFAPSWLAFTRPLAQLHPYKKAGTDWENIVYHNIKKRTASSAKTSDLFDRLLINSRGEDLNLSPGELLAECSAMMNAGTETTTAAMTNTVFLLYSHPDVLAKLRVEIDEAFPGNEMPRYERASQLPYLRACIEESLRVRPASSFGLPRIVPAGGRTIAGQFIQEGVTVSVPTYSLLRDESVFDRATEYDPDRWMTDDQDKKRRMMANHLPFSTGPRACIGRNIAYFEQIVIIATLVKFYDCTVPEGFELETQERFNSNPGPLVVGVARRHR